MKLSTIQTKHIVWTRTKKFFSYFRSSVWISPMSRSRSWNLQSTTLTLCQPQNMNAECVTMLWPTFTPWPNAAPAPHRSYIWVPPPAMLVTTPTSSSSSMGWIFYCRALLLLSADSHNSPKNTSMFFVHQIASCIVIN